MCPLATLKSRTKAGAQVDSDSTLLYIIGARPADVLPLGYSIFQGFVYISNIIFFLLSVYG
jgi:hypothetical protein